MPSANFYAVNINRKSGVTFEDVKEKMDLALDWYRMGETFWVLYSTSDVQKLYERLEPVVKDTGRVFICKSDQSERQGWMDKDFWKWIRREKDS